MAGAVVGKWLYSLMLADTSPISPFIVTNSLMPSTRTTTTEQQRTDETIASTVLSYLKIISFWQDEIMKMRQLEPMERKTLGRLEIGHKTILQPPHMGT